MFAALKRITGKGETPTLGGLPATPRPGLQSMAHNLQRKFARGVQYNSKSSPSLVLILILCFLSSNLVNILSFNPVFSENHNQRRQKRR